MHTGEKKRCTIADIAREAGVSKTSVSFAFNSPHRIGDETRKRILEVARRLKYVPDPSARNFSLGRTQTLGFLLPQAVDTCLANPYIVEVMKGLGQVCQEHGYMLTLIPPLNDSVYEAVKNATVDGLITLGYMVHGGVGSLVDVRAMPLMMIDGGEGGRHLSVNIDDMGAARLQLERVLALGHRRISILSLPAPTLTPNVDDKGIVGRRLAGYREALEAYGLSLDDLRCLQGEATWQAGWDLASSLAEGGTTCIVTMSDIQALGIIDRLGEDGLSVPRDISLVGFDNINRGMASRPRLSTIDQPGFEKGQMAAMTMFDILDGKSVEKAPLVGYSFVDGGTLAPPKGE